MAGGLAFPTYWEGDKVKVTRWWRRSHHGRSRPEEGSYRDKVPWFQERSDSGHAGGWIRELGAGRGG